MPTAIDYRAPEQVLDLLPERFWSKFTEEPNTGCWLWFGATNTLGYGHWKLGDKVMPAHRIAYLFLRGPIPEGMVLDHLCRVPCCVNPDHLRIVTNRENLFAAGSLAPAKANAAKTHCKRGHEFTPENTRTFNGMRHCVICRNERSKLWMRRRHVKVL